uniref:Protein kinase domain-containing protein n=1 Tax=Tetradesmus obliquus TaxID=3088 RepID=A0A383WPB6_TETOB|eukprot:jgi/Sobl393_1/4673/SZX79300.1
MIFSSRADANKQGWKDYRQWLANRLQQPQQKCAGPSFADQHAPLAAAAQKLSPAVLGQKRPTPEPDEAFDSVEAQCPTLHQQQQQRLRRTQRAASAAGTAGGTAATEASSPDALRSRKKQKRAPKATAGAAAQQQTKRRAAPAAGLRLPPAAAAAAAAAAAGREGAGSNRPSIATTAAAAAGVAAPGAAADHFPTTMSIWLPGSKNSTTPKCSSKRLQLNMCCCLGRGGFGEVHKAAVKAIGPNSLSALKLRGSAGAAVSQLLAGAAAAAGSSAGSSSSVTMALKMAPPFHSTSAEVQGNHNNDADLYLKQAQQRMLSEFRLMTACAASPHIVDAFAAGSITVSNTVSNTAAGGPVTAALPAILMEFAEFGDVQGSLLEGRLQRPLRFPGLPAKQQPKQQQQPQGLSSAVSQRIVRAAALALRDLHDLAGHMHCDVKANNLLVFGSAANPIIKLCDLGVAKPRTELPQYGPVSGTKEWQAPEQASNTAGRLDFCIDSWGLGLLLLCLRRGRRPFWWLQEVGVMPAEFAATLAASLSKPDSLYCQAENGQPGSALGPLEVAFVQRCMGSSSERPPPCLLLQDDPYLSSRYKGG